jgi:hypothetical protein
MPRQRRSTRPGRARAASRHRRRLGALHGRRAAAPPTKGATVYREGKSSSTAAPEALAVGGQPERDYNKRGAGPFPWLIGSLQRD